MTGNYVNRIEQVELAMDSDHSHSNGTAGSIKSEADPLRSPSTYKYTEGWHTAKHLNTMGCIMPEECRELYEKNGKCKPTLSTAQRGLSGTRGAGR